MSTADAVRTLLRDALLVLLMLVGIGVCAAGIHQHANALAFVGLGVAVVFALLLQSAATLDKLRVIATAAKSAKDAAKAGVE